jgi:AmiR/NasT family two-component response regulator
MLRSLLISRDENTVRTISRVFKDLDVELEHCSEATQALSSAAKLRYDAIVIDDCTEEAAAVSKELIALPESGKSVRIVLAEPTSSVDPVFKAGIQVVLYKPLSADRVRQGLRAVRNLMSRDRRVGGKRVRTTLYARVRHARGSGAQVVVADLSETGAAIQIPSQAMVSARNLQMDFALPDGPERIHVSVELVWQDNKGAAGVRFLDMASSARKRLSHWLSEEACKVEHHNSLSLSHAAGR